MKVEQTGAAAFTAVFESEEELRTEHRTNLVAGGLRLPTPEKFPPRATIQVRLIGPWGGEVSLRATVVAQVPNGIALAFEGNGDSILEQLLVQPAGSVANENEPEEIDEDSSGGAPREKSLNVWDRIRNASQMEKILLAVKADRSERAMLLQDNDPRVLLSLLRNPRLTVDEVVRLAKSTFLTYQIAEVIMKSGQWMASLDVRLGLIHNAKTPPAFGLRILPTLPDSEVRAIARGGTSMALKTAALRKLQGKA